MVLINHLRRNMRKPTAPALNVHDDKCVHYHFVRDKEYRVIEVARCLNGVAKPASHQRHGWLCFEHMPKPRRYMPTPVSAWDDYLADPRFIVAHDRKLMDAARRG